MRSLLIVCALTALAACSRPAGEAPETPAAESAATPDAPESMQDAWAAARAEGVDFRAVGQEPGWMLDIYRADRITLMWDYGESDAAFPLVAPTYPQEGATRYDTQADGHTLAITIRRFPCEDAMSGQPYPSTVVVEIDGRTLEGCGLSL